MVKNGNKKSARVLTGSSSGKATSSTRTRRSIQAIKLEGAAGNRARSGKLTELELKSVSNEIQNQYAGYYHRLEVFSRENGLSWPLKIEEADKVLADYMDVLFLDKKAPAEGEKTLAALEFFQIELKMCLPRSRRALRGWRKCMPAQSRLPIPKTLMYGMSMLMLHRGKRDMALMVMAAFDLYLRQGEGLSLVARNIVAPIPVAGSQFRVVTVIVRDFDSGVPDKVGVYDTSLRMDNPKTAWVGEFLLKKAKEVNSKDDLIFSFNMEEYRKEFIAVGKLLGVDQLHPYQLRHGGASQDLCSGFRDHQGVKGRGRWVTDQSVRRYAKIGRVQQPNSLNYCTWAETNLEKVFRGVLPSRGL